MNSPDKLETWAERERRKMRVIGVVLLVVFCVLFVIFLAALALAQELPAAPSAVDGGAGTVKPMLLYRIARISRPTGTVTIFDPPDPMEIPSPLGTMVAEQRFHRADSLAVLGPYLHRLAEREA